MCGCRLQIMSITAKAPIKGVFVCGSFVYNVITMSAESPQLDTLKTEHVHLDKDSHVNYTVLELKDIAKQSNLELENHFEAHEADIDTREMIVAHYESMLSTQEAFLGIGNTALVFKQHPKAEQSDRCVKCRWDFLMVNNKSKKINLLPENLRRLKLVEDHFEKVTQKWRTIRGRGIEILADNNSLREAVIQHMASKILSEAGMSGKIPDINFIVKVEREESGDVDGDPFSANETVNLMFMDQIQGTNIEELIQHASTGVAERIDVDKIELELKAMIGLLHKEGIAHRDMTIRNIMLDSETLLPHIIDFGRAVYSENLADSDKADDIMSTAEVVKFLRKFKKDPVKMAEELKDLQKLTN